MQLALRPAASRSSPVLPSLLACVVVAVGCGGGAGSGVEQTEPARSVDAVQANSAPNLRIEHGPLEGAAPLRLWADAGASADPDGDAIAFTWFVDGVEAGSDAAFVFTFTSPGTFVLRVEARDPRGKTAEQRLNIRVDPASGLQGRLLTSPGIVLDGDVNDPSLPRHPNDSLDTAQTVDGEFSAVIGHVAAQGVGSTDGASFASGDNRDYFSFDARTGDFLRLAIADRAQDLDLVLYASDGTRIDASVGVSNIELVGPIPADGRYIAEVRVFGASASLYRLGLSTRADPFELASRIKPTTEMDRHHAYIRDGDPGDGQHRRRRGRVLELEDNASRCGAPLDQLLPAHLVALKRLAREHRESRVEPVFLRQALSLPEDEWFPYQWNLQQAGFPAAWKLTQGNEDVIVAVIDSGIHLEHPEFLGTSRLVPGFDFVSDAANAGDGDGFDDDPSDVSPIAGNSGFHGTHVAGIVAAEVAASGTPSLRHSVAGAGWNVRVMPLRVLGLDGGASADLVEAIRYAAGLPNASGRLPDRRADVINLSLGSPQASAAEQEAIEAARAEGVIIVAAAGNAGSDQPFYPAAYPGVISVGATGPDGGLTYYSSYGEHLGLVAPGGDMSADSDSDGFPDGILAPLAEQDDQGRLRPIIGLRAGTSMAAPLVAAAAGLMKSVNPALDPDMFDVLLATGRLTVDLGEAGRDVRHGEGLLDAGRATAAALELLDETRVPAMLTVAPRRLDFGISSTTAEIDVSLLGRFAGDVFTTLETDLPWLIVDAVDVAAGGTGRYLVRVDRAQLPEGRVQFGVVRVRGPENTVSVAVSAQQPPSSPQSDIGPLHVRVRSVDGGITASRIVEAGGEKAYPFTLPLSEGAYYLEAGSDLDHDGMFCDDGEFCGVFPSEDYLVPIEVDGQGYTAVDLLLSVGINARQVE